MLCRNYFINHRLSRLIVINRLLDKIVSTQRQLELIQYRLWVAFSFYPYYKFILCCLLIMNICLAKFPWFLKCEKIECIKISDKILFVFKDTIEVLMFFFLAANSEAVTRQQWNIPSSHLVSLTSSELLKKITASLNIFKNLTELTFVSFLPSYNFISFQMIRRVCAYIPPVSYRMMAR